MKKPSLLALPFAILSLFALTSPAHAEGSAEKGSKLFLQRCNACHAPDKNLIGPALGGVVGRKAGTAADYNYSDALKKSGVTWDEAQLDKWLTNPGMFAPGTKMVFRVFTPGDRADIIAYLKTLKAAAK
jgi:cytochrome c